MSLVHDHESEAYSCALDPRWVQIFSNQEYSLIDRDKRMQIGRGQGMADLPMKFVIHNLAYPVNRRKGHTAVFLGLDGPPPYVPIKNAPQAA